MNMEELNDIFNEHLPSLVDNFVVREQQLKYAETIASIMLGRSNGLVEAGTGIGKTFGYLIPLLHSNERVIISTGTRNLQDQLFFKDLPQLSKLFKGKRLSVLKGRSNYLCVHRLKNSLKVVAKGENLDKLLDFRSWSSRTDSGDLTEVVDVEAYAGTLRLVTSTKDNCFGRTCPEFDNCFLYRARDRAARSEVVIVNHHLLFANLARQEDALESILPRTQIVLVDEAHRVPDVARQYFGQQISSGEITDVIRDIATELALLGDDDPMTRKALSEFEIEVGQLTQQMMTSETVDYKIWLKEDVMVSLENFDLALNGLISHLGRVSERSVALRQLLKRSSRLADLFALVTEKVIADKHYIRWLDRRVNSFSIYLSPISISEPLRQIFQDPEVNWIFTSATLSLDGDFGHMQATMGLESAKCSSFDSPFDYSQVVRAWLPDALPLPGSETHIRGLVEALLPLISCNPGKTLFLFTSYKAMRQAASMISGLERPFLMQGAMSRAELTRAFIERPGAVLLATQSFWEGVDFRGTDLRCLIIDKLPFPNPVDPVYAAQAEQITNSGGDSFAEFALPKAILALKQGFGRLIRQESDRGLFVLGDSRLRSREYGDFILSKLPEMIWLDSLDDASQWLRKL